MTAATYSRPLSALERYSLVIHGVYRYHVDAIVEGVGPVDAGHLQAAVDRAAAANPAIRVRLHGWLAWCRWVDGGRAPQVRELPLADWDGSSGESARFLEEKLDPRRAVADVLLVPCRDGRTRIVFRSLHAAIDGRGCIHWLLDVCRAMRGETPAGSQSRLTDDAVKDRHAERLGEPQPEPPQQCIPVLAPTPGAECGPLRFVWRRVLLDRDVPQLLTKAAVFLAEHARMREPGDIGFTVPVDFRGLRTDEMGIGNLTGYLHLRVNEGASSRSLMAQLGRRVRAYDDCRHFDGHRKLRWMPLWLMLRQLRAGLHALLYTVNGALPSGGVVSMGSLRAEQFDMPGFRAERAYGIPGAVGKLNFIFISYPDHVCAIFGAPAAYNRDGQLDELAESFRLHFSQPQCRTGTDA